MENKQRYARLSGLLYLVVIICGVFAELVVRHELVVPGDSTTSAGIILDHEAYWRWGFVADGNQCPDGSRHHEHEYDSSHRCFIGAEG